MMHHLREILRIGAGRGANPTAVVIDSRTLQSTPESGHRGAYDGPKRKKGSKVHIAVETRDHLLALHIVKLSEAKRGFVLLPRRWVVERSFAWMRRFRRLANDLERLLRAVAGLHFAVFACIMLARCFAMSA